jgi:hypothetical protein
MYGRKSTSEVPTINYVPRCEAIWRGGTALNILKLSNSSIVTLLAEKGFPMPIGQDAGWAQKRCGKYEISRNAYADVKLDFHLVILVY